MEQLSTPVGQHLVQFCTLPCPCLPVLLRSGALWFWWILVVLHLPWHSVRIYLLVGPAGNLLVKVHSSFDGSTLSDRILLSNFHASVPGRLVTQDNDTLALYALPTAPVTYMLEVNKGDETELTGQVQVFQGVNKSYEVYVNGSAGGSSSVPFYDGVVVNNVTWAELYAESRSLDAILQQNNASTQLRR
jgi:hypothetical protein